MVMICCFVTGRHLCKKVLGLIPRKSGQDPSCMQFRMSSQHIRVWKREQSASVCQFSESCVLVRLLIYCPVD